METEQPMRIFCKANTTLNAAVRGDKVILVPADSSDKSQHWIKDCSAIGKLTDEDDSKAFALVNRTTGQAMVNFLYGEEEVQLAPYSGHVAVELSKLWTLEQRGDGFSHVRALQNIGLTLNALRGEPVKEGSVVGTYRAQDHPHAIWKIVPINED